MIIFKVFSVFNNIMKILVEIITDNQTFTPYIKINIRMIFTGFTFIMSSEKRVEYFYSFPPLYSHQAERH